MDCVVKVWDLKASISDDQVCLQTIEEHSSYVFALQFNGFQVITGSEDQSFVIHDFFKTMENVEIDEEIMADKEKSPGTNTGTIKMSKNN